MRDFCSLFFLSPLIAHFLQAGYTEKQAEGQNNV
jgi:hypothetical protein